MAQAVLLGDPAHFHIRSGGNPHTRDRFGRRKKVNTARAVEQWLNLKAALEECAAKVFIVPAVKDLPGLVFPANAGFRYGERVVLSNLNPGRSGEKEHYRRALERIPFLQVIDFPDPHPFEGEADFFPVGDPSGDPQKSAYLFTYGPIRQQRWVPRWGFPPYRRVYGFRSDQRALSGLKRIVTDREIIPLELTLETHYHGDTVFCSFGPHREFLLVYLEALEESSRLILTRRFKDRLVPLSRQDGERFAANSFQVGSVLLMPDGLTGAVYREVRSRGVVPCPVDVSEFLEKGGGSVKCMLMDLGQVGG
ncbi:MAG: hypothetical protein NC910_03250 [Candidatus Omnitrophica bacterium]|nr:hypothetical protein [Candidatus Omnitrophota bacterium]